MFMTMKKIIVPIAGMHCRSCELLIEGNLAEIPEVRKSEVDCKKGTATVYYETQKPALREIEGAVREAGYTIGTTGRLPWVSRHMSDWQDLGIAVLALFLVYVAIQVSGVAGWSPVATTGNPSSLGIVFLVGITAGLSTCLALVGGLVLGVAARHAEAHPEASATQKFRPHLFFNLGRVAGYALGGVILGSLGSALHLSSGFFGAMIVVVSLVMLVLGVKLLGVFPRISDWSLTLPKSVSRFVGLESHRAREYSHGNAMVLGALTFFLPCGFTQSMQLLAVASGAPVSGALIMGVFVLGTAPGLLAIGGVASAVRGVFARRFFVFSGLVVIAFAFWNIGNGARLLGWLGGGTTVADSRGEVAQSASQKPAATPTVAKPVGVSVENGVQVIRMTENNRGYTPNHFYIEKGMPVRLEIDAQSPYSCASTIVIPSLDIQKNLEKGLNIIEFTPQSVGTINFSCSMGMYSGSFEVITKK